MAQSKSSRCIFVGGVHGMGKSSLCSNSAMELDIGHYVASDLIKNYKNLDAGLHKEVRSVTKNQETLLCAINELVNHPTYLLDGHFVIRAEGLGLVRIPFETFDAIAPQAIIVVTGDEQEASERIFARDRKNISKTQLAEMQTMEIEHAKSVALDLKIPLIIQSNLESANFTRLVARLLHD